jgi:hypothetical protein
MVSEVLSTPFHTVTKTEESSTTASCESLEGKPVHLQCEKAFACNTAKGYQRKVI